MSYPNRKTYPNRKKFFEPSPLCWPLRKSAVDLLTESFPKQPLLEKASFGLALSLIPRWASRIPHSIGGIYNCRYWCIAASDEKVIGLTCIYQRTHDHSKTAWLGRTCVAPEFQGHGLGAYLFDFAIEKSREANMERLNAYTGRKNVRAIQVLQRRGFNRIARDHSSRESGLIYFGLSMSIAAQLPVKRRHAA